MTLLSFRRRVVYTGAVNFTNFTTVAGVGGVGGVGQGLGDVASVEEKKNYLDRHG